MYFAVLIHAKMGSKYKFVYKIAGLMLLYSVSWTICYAWQMAANDADEDKDNPIIFFIADASFSVAQWLFAFKYHIVWFEMPHVIN